MNRPSYCYIATTRDDPDMLAMAHASILALRQQHSKAEVKLIVDLPTNQLIDHAYRVIREVVDEVKPFDTGIEDGAASSRFLKTNLRSLVDGDLIFLDIDTIVLRDVSALAKHNSTLAGVQDDSTAGGRFAQPLLDRFEQMGWPPPREPYLNSGVLFWRDNEAGRALGKAWHRFWHESRQVMGDTDQPPLQRAMQETQPSITLLGEDYNHKVRDCPQRLKRPAILHYTTRSALNSEHVLMNHLIHYVKAHGELDVKAVEKARRRNDPWISAGPGIKGNWCTGRYTAALKMAASRLVGR